MASKVPELPDELLRLIWAKHWQREHGACQIQRAVRATIARAQGDPWDLPALIPAEDTHTHYTYYGMVD